MINLSLLEGLYLFNNHGLKKVLTATFAASILFTTADVTPVKAEEKQEIKNIIFLIGDGMGPSYVTAHRYMKDNPETQEMELTGFDPYLVGMQSVYSADPYYDGDEDDEKENIPDSAATATSMSSGVKTYNGAIAVDMEHVDTKTVLEVAKEKGKSTGLVVTSQVNHATPAAYGAHELTRQNYNEIADDYYDDLINGEHKIDVILGGGTDYFIREDRNITEEFQADGFNYVTTTDELLANTNKQVLGLFAPVGLEKAIDRPAEQPSLQQMTAHALEMLSKNEEGFFLMIEGSQIDWAGHDNDVVASMSEMEDFEQAFNEAIEFAKKDKHTLVVATADHSTGGFSIGANGPYTWDVDVIKAAKHTPDYLARKIVEDNADVKQTLAENITFDLTEEEITSVQEALDNAAEDAKVTEVDNAIERIFDERSGTGWTTDGHTGEDVPVYAYGPGSELFAGLIDNTDNAVNIFNILESDGKVQKNGAELAETASAYPAKVLTGLVIVSLGGLFFIRKRKPSESRTL